ncbi:MAG: hypothetical protein Q7R95_01900, partial [bacterium]|nr:hypothetical protein [bacterium]
MKDKNEQNTQVIKGFKGFKGFDKNFKCRDFQFEVGKTYTHDGEVEMCNSGFHFCENPLDIFSYYQPGQSKFAKVEGNGDIKIHSDDSKVACKSISIEAEVNLKTIIDFGVKFIFNKIDWKNPIETTTGERANAATTGDGANAATTGERANAATTGDGANAATTGDGANAATTG